MNITKVVVQPLTGSSGGRLLAFANLIVDDQYVVNGLRIYRNRNGERKCSTLPSTLQSNISA